MYANNFEALIGEVGSKGSSDTLFRNYAGQAVNVVQLERRLDGKTYFSVIH
jgi:hypothetical protein